MIRNFANPETELVWRGQRSRKLPPAIQQTARRKMRAINRATAPHQLANPGGNHFKELKGDRKATYSVRINDQWRTPSAGPTETRTMSGSRTIIEDEDRLDNVHPGDILREDFLIGTAISFEEVAEGAGIDVAVLREIVASKHHIDAAIGARLARYFGMSEGFFLGLQHDYDLEEVRRREGAELDRIVPRAA